MHTISLRSSRPPARSTQSFPGVIFGAPFTRRTWAELAYAVTDPLAAVAGLACVAAICVLGPAFAAVAGTSATTALACIRPLAAAERARARALLHLNTIPERFGLVLAEANASGVPVIAMDLGSCREVIQEGQTGFLVNNVNEAVRTLERLSEIDRNECRKRVQQCFSVDTMVQAYERVYSDIFALEAARRS